MKLVAALLRALLELAAMDGARGQSTINIGVP